MYPARVVNGTDECSRFYCWPAVMQANGNSKLNKSVGFGGRLDGRGGLEIGEKSEDRPIRAYACMLPDLGQGRRPSRHSSNGCGATNDVI